MVKLIKAARLFAVSAVIAAPLFISTSSRAFADATAQPLQILPVCSSFADNVAKWNITNPNSSSVDFTWTNSVQGSGTQTVAAGQTLSGFQTAYNNRSQTVKFVAGGVSQIISNLNNQTDGACGSTVVNNVPACLPTDYASLRGYLTFTWTDKSHVTIGTIGNAPLCDPNHTNAGVNINLSSYLMPVGYNGDFFTGNPTAVDQTLTANTVVTLKNGLPQGGEFPVTNIAPVSASVDVPVNCNNVQTDVSMGTVPTTLTSTGTLQYLAGGIYQSTGACEGGKGGGPTTPTPSTPTLTNTGVNIRFTSVIAAGVIAAAVFVFTRRTKVSE